MKFKKMHGLGNDFVIFDHRKQDESLSPEQIKKICDRHFGVGCDQLVILKTSEKADVKALFYNSDGSESGACGNASRCIGDIIMSEQNAQTCVIETGGGLLNARRSEKYKTDGVFNIEVDMGIPNLPDKKFQDVIDGLLNPVLVDMGNPHAVYFIEKYEDVDIAKTGRKIETHEFFPDATNVEFVKILNTNEIKLKTWERGAGLTLACGSGACAAVVAGISSGHLNREVMVFLDGGILNIEWRESDNHVLMSGPVSYVFEGELETND